MAPSSARPRASCQVKNPPTARHQAARVGVADAGGEEGDEAQCRRRRQWRSSPGPTSFQPSRNDREIRNPAPGYDALFNCSRICSYGYTAVLVVLLLAHLTTDAWTRKIACIRIRRLAILQGRQMEIMQVAINASTIHRIEAMLQACCRINLGLAPQIKHAAANGLKVISSLHLRSAPETPEKI